MANVSFSLEDFFGYYVRTSQKPPTIYDSLDRGVTGDEISAFYTSIPMKKEFSTLRTVERLKLENFRGLSLYNHQEFMARFMSPHTPYNRMLVYHGVGTGKCVHPDTTITTYAGDVPIKSKISSLFDRCKGSEISVPNDSGRWFSPKASTFVASFDPTTRSLVKRKILRFYVETVDTILKKIITETEREIVCTFQHKLFCGDKGFTNNINTGDWVYVVGDHGEPQAERVASVGVIKYRGPVYDLEVDEFHTYIADDFVTHNTCLMITVAEAAMQIDPTLNKVIILVPSETLLQNPRKELTGKCTDGKYEAKYTKDSYGKKLNDSEIKRQVTNNIKPFYSIQTYNEFANAIAILTDEELINRYTNTYIFIDEAHNLKKTETKSKKKYEQIHRFLHTVPSLKALLLTGTPMIHTPTEIVSLINLINPLENQLETDEFKKWWDGKNFTHGPEFKAKYLFGKVSHVATRNVDMLYAGDELDPENGHDIRVVKLPMSVNQSSAYVSAIRQDTSEAAAENTDDIFGDGFVDEEDEKEDDETFGYKNSRAASNFVFPNSTWGISGEDNYMDKTSLREKKLLVLKEPMKKFLSAKITPAMTDEEKINSKLEQLEKLSAKFAYIIKLALGKINGKQNKIFVYSDKVSGGGILLLGAILQEFGYEMFDPKTKDISGILPGKRFVVFTQETTPSSDQVSRLLNTGPEEGRIINSAKNMRGGICQVVLASKKASEGVDITHIRDVVLLNSWWNMPRIDQAIGRATRSGGHDGLPRSEQNVTVHRLLAEPVINLDEGGDVLVIDEYVYGEAEVRDKMTKQIERLLKEASVDCVLNLSRNTMTGGDGSRQCDYTTCDIKCDSVSPAFKDSAYYKWGSIEDTYNLYYAEEEIRQITETVVKLFGYRSSWNFTELAEKMPAGIASSSIVLARALKNIITDNIPIKNRLGFVNYLREENNVYFLVDDPAGTILHTLAWYASNPTPKISGTTKDLTAILSEKNLSQVMANLEKTASDKVQTAKKLALLPPGIRDVIEKTCADVPDSQKSQLCQTIADIVKVEYDPDLYEWYWFDGANELTKEKFLIRRKPLQRKTATGAKPDKRQDRPGMACASGDYGSRYLLWMVYWLNKRAAQRGETGPFAHAITNEDSYKALLDPNADPAVGELREDIVRSYQSDQLGKYWKTKIAADPREADKLLKLVNLPPKEAVPAADLVLYSDEEWFWWFYNDKFSAEKIRSWYNDSGLPILSTEEIIKREAGPHMSALYHVIKPPVTRPTEKSKPLQAQKLCSGIQSWFTSKNMMRKVVSKPRGT
jgi:hypothetical protein